MKSRNKINNRKHIHHIDHHLRHALLYLTTGLLTTVLCFSYIRLVYSAAPSVGAVNFWYSTNSATRVNVTMTPNKGESGYHFYSITSLFQDQNYGLYSGIQTNGNLGNGVDVGNVFIFSVWNATAAFPASGATATPFGGEGVGYSLRKQFDWTVGKAYKVSVQRESFDEVNNGWLWSANIQDVATGATVNLGSIRAPAGASLLRGGSLFHERFQGTTPNCNQNSSNLEAASVSFSQLSADKTSYFYGSPASNNIFSDSSCDNFTHAVVSGGKATSGFGITENEFKNIAGISNSPQSQTPSTPNNGSGSAGDTAQNNTSQAGDTAPQNQAQNEQNANPEASGDFMNDGLSVQPTNNSNATNKETQIAHSSSTGIKIIGAMSVPSLSLGIFFLLKHRIFRL